MSRKKTHHTKQFKLDAVNYRKEHPDLTQVATNQKNKEKLPVSNVNYGMLRMHLMC